MKKGRFIVLVGLLLVVQAATALQSQEYQGDNRNKKPSLSENEKKLAVKRDYTPCTSATCDSYGEFLRSLPRFTFDGTHLTNNWSPKNNKYIQSLELIGAPFLIIGSLALIGGILLMTWMFCSCKCCSVGYPKNHLRQRKQQPCEKSRRFLLARFSFLILCIFICMVAIAGLLYNVTLHSNLRSSFDTIMATEDRIIRDDVNVLVSLLQKLNSYDEVITPPVENIILRMNAIYKDSNQKKIELTRKENIRSTLTAMALGSVWLFVILSVIGVWRIRRKVFLAMITLCLGTLFLVSQWIIPAVHVPLSVFLADMCPFVEEKISDIEPQEWIEYYLSCKGPNPFADVTTKIQTKETQVAALLEWAIENGYPQSAIDKLRKILAELQTMDERLSDLADCRPAQDAWESSTKSLCTKAFDSILVINIVSLINGTVMTICILLYAYLFSKSRFDQETQSYRLNTIEEEESLLDEEDEKLVYPVDRTTA